LSVWLRGLQPVTVVLRFARGLTPSIGAIYLVNIKFGILIKIRIALKQLVDAKNSWKKQNQSFKYEIALFEGALKNRHFL
jgi:hypothetical protein